MRLLKNQTDGKVGRHRERYCIYNETQRQKQRESSRESGTQTARGRCNLGKQKLCLSRTKTLVISFPQVFPEIFYKYSITSFPDRHAWDAHYETLRIGLRRIRNSLDETVTYFCRCLYLMKLLLEDWLNIQWLDSSYVCVWYTVYTCFPHVLGFVMFGDFLRVSLCMLGVTLSPSAQQAYTPYRNISQLRASSSISALTGWALTACLKFRILSSKPSGRNQRRGGAAWNCRFRDFPLSRPTHMAAELYGLAYSRIQQQRGLWHFERQCLHGIVLSSPWKASFDNLFVSSSVFPPLSTPCHSLYDLR